MIVKDKNICYGRPTVSGTRVDVATVLGNIRDGETFDGVCSLFGITLKDIEDCFDYAIWQLGD